MKKKATLILVLAGLSLTGCNFLGQIKDQAIPKTIDLFRALGPDLIQAGVKDLSSIISTPIEAVGLSKEKGEEETTE